MMLHPVTLHLLGHAYRQDLEREARGRRLRSDLGPEVGGPVDARSGLRRAYAAPTGVRGDGHQPCCPGCGTDGCAACRPGCCPLHCADGTRPAPAGRPPRLAPA